MADFVFMIGCIVIAIGGPLLATAPPEHRGWAALCVTGAVGGLACWLLLFRLLFRVAS